MFFSHAQLFCRGHEDWILQNPEEFGQVFAAGLLSATPEYARLYAADAHYLAPGIEYKPYLG